MRLKPFSARKTPVRSAATEDQKRKSGCHREGECVVVREGDGRRRDRGGQALREMTPFRVDTSAASLSGNRPPCYKKHNQSKKANEPRRDRRRKVLVVDEEICLGQEG